MAERGDLTLAFLEAHPGDAARVLERLPTAEAAALFAAVPARAASTTLGAMLPTAAARTLGALPDDAATTLLGGLGAQAAISILRHVPDARRDQLIGQLPTTTAVASRLLLGYPEDSVGAWTDPDVVALTASLRVGDALARVRAAGETRVDEVFVVGESERLLGTVGLAVLVRATESTPLAGLALRPAAVLPAATPLAGAATHRGWQHAAGLPVVETGERLVGVLRRATLARALARHRQTQAPQGDDAFMRIVARGYWGAVAGLVAAGLALLPEVSHVAPESSDEQR